MPSRLRRSSSATTCCASGGFSLLEVLVALAILGIGLGVVFQGIGLGLRVRGTAAENTRLAIVAERVLGELPERTEAPAAPEEGEDSGCRWRLETIDSAVASPGDPDAPLVEVRLTVTGPTGRSWEISTLLPLGEQGNP